MADTQLTRKGTTRTTLARLATIPIFATAIATLTIASGTVAAMEFYPETRDRQNWTGAIALSAYSRVDRSKFLPTRLDPQIQARRQPVQTLLIEAEKLVKQGEVNRAIATYDEAQVLSHSLEEISANSWNTLCWFGTLWGHASDVIDACDKAIAQSPQSEEFRDSRGVARALTGDTKGAIEDFQTFVNSTKDEERKYQRQSWINALRIGENPFTPELIKALLRE